MLHAKLVAKSFSIQGSCFESEQIYGGQTHFDLNQDER